MPANRNALIRYKTIDNCLRNPYRRWTLEDLVDACSDALYEYEGIDKGISKRTVQMDTGHKGRFRKNIPYKSGHHLTRGYHAQFFQEKFRRRCDLYLKKK